LPTEEAKRKKKKEKNLTFAANDAASLSSSHSFSLPPDAFYSPNGILISLSFSPEGGSVFFNPSSYVG